MPTFQNSKTLTADYAIFVVGKYNNIIYLYAHYREVRTKKATRSWVILIT